MDSLETRAVTKVETDGDHPASHYLVVEDPEKPSTWHLRVKDTSGKPDHRLMGAAWAALHGGYRGNKYQGPKKAEAIAALKALYKSEGLSTPSENDLFFTIPVENRCWPGCELRLLSDGKGNPKIGGYAAVFNSLSRPLMGFREIVMPGAFDRAVNSGADVRALVNHDPARILGRTKSGTLRLSSDTKGLAVEIDPPDTQPGRDTVESIRRGDLSQMSFGFRVVDETWRVENKENIRELRDVELFDVSVVAFPAYEETQAEIRLSTFFPRLAEDIQVVQSAIRHLSSLAEDRESVRDSVARLESFLSKSAHPDSWEIENLKLRLRLHEAAL